MIAQHYICIANIDVDDDCDCECCDGYGNQIIYIYISMRTAAPIILITRTPIGISDAQRRNRSAIPLSMLFTGFGCLTKRQRENKEIYA